MRKIWLALSAFVLLGTLLAGAPAHAADVPQVTPDDRVLGKADAKITIFEFFSLTCPHCAEFAEKTFPKLKAEWIDTGKAKLVYRDFPLDAKAIKAAEVARCGPPERYPAFVEALFQQQMVWAVAPDNEPLHKIARLGGISDDQFNKCINDQALEKTLLGDEFEAQQKYGVDATPTFFINGTKVVGALPYEDFAKALESASAALPK